MTSSINNDLFGCSATQCISGLQTGFQPCSFTGVFGNGKVQINYFVVAIQALLFPRDKKYKLQVDLWMA